MALGGGIFISQNKTLPGAYINFISASRASAAISDRGYAAMPLALDWGVENEVFTVTAQDFYKNSNAIFGYAYTDEKLKPLRELFKNTRVAYLFRLNSGGTKAANVFATALYGGIRGNALSVCIEANENSTPEKSVYNVITLLAGTTIDVQTVETAAQLKPNGYVSFIGAAALSLTAGTPLSGGSNGENTDAAYQSFLDKIESYSFNVLGCASDSSVIKALFSNFTKRMRDEVGVKFQCVLHKYAQADNEGIISVENNTVSDLVYWVTGASAGCPINESLTNKSYDGEMSIDTNYTQLQLEGFLKSGNLVFHRVGSTARVLDDINTFVSVSDIKNDDFKSNQTVRILDQIGNDDAVLFNERYHGRVLNDNAGRISLWKDIVKHRREIEKIRAIEDFQPDSVKVEPGDTKKSVLITSGVKPVSAMTQMYMTVIVE